MPERFKIKKTATTKRPLPLQIPEETRSDVASKILAGMCNGTENEFALFFMSEILDGKQNDQRQGS